MFFFASPRHFDFLNCKTKTSECFNANTRCLKITGNNKQTNQGKRREGKQKINRDEEMWMKDPARQGNTHSTEHEGQQQQQQQQQQQ